MLKLSKKTQQWIQTALAEDVRNGDITAKYLVPQGARIRAKIFAREPGVFCGVPVAEILRKKIDPKIRFQWKTQDGEVLEKNQVALVIQGPAQAVLAMERTLLNYLAHLSGVATMTARLVKMVRKQGIEIFDTRKTTPLMRELEKNAVRAGGGKNHRMGLYDEIFVKENHRAFGLLHKLQKIPRKFVIEVRNKRELDQALMLKPRVILFDNYPPKRLKKSVNYVRTLDKKVLLEASGGITQKNILQYARAGIDQISLGSLTHSVRSLNFSMLVD